MNKPTLFSKEPTLRMTKKNFSEEILLIRSMAQPDNRFEGPYIYSIEIKSPRDLHELVKWDAYTTSFSPSALVELRNGYLYHTVIYFESPEVVEKLLTEISSVANRIEVSLRSKSTGQTEKKEVFLTTGPENL